MALFNYNPTTYNTTGADAGNLYNAYQNTPDQVAQQGKANQDLTYATYGTSNPFLTGNGIGTTQTGPTPPGGSRTDTAQNPAPATTSTGLRDMSGQYYAGRLIPQGWSMDNQGNWSYQGGSQPQQQSGVTTLPASYVTTAFNPAETAANLKAGGYTQNADGSWSNPNKYAQDWQSIYGSGTAPAGSLNGVTGGPTPAPGQNPPASSPSPAPTQTPFMGGPVGGGTPPVGAPNTNNYLTQLLMGLFGAQQPSYRAVRTPLGYTQYQSSMPQGNNAQGLDPMTQLILAMLMGGGGMGGSQNSFWNLLGAQ